jgi:hypothetical protein
MNAESKRATGWINVTSIEPTPYDEMSAGTIAEVRVTEEFSGDLRGTGTVRFLMLTLANGSATFVGLERFVGEIAGRTGSFVFRNTGTLRDGQVEAEWIVVAGSATGELDGLRGQGGCNTQLGLFLDYWFE